MKSETWNSSKNLLSFEQVFLFFKTQKLSKTETKLFFFKH
jgi:hypothetical protein